MCLRPQLPKLYHQLSVCFRKLFQGLLVTENRLENVSISVHDLCQTRSCPTSGTATVNLATDAAGRGGLSLRWGRSTWQMLQVRFSVGGTQIPPLSTPVSQALLVMARAESCGASRHRPSMRLWRWDNTAPHKLCRYGSSPFHCKE